MHNRGGYQSNKRGGTRGKVDRGHSDAGGVALKAWREQLGRAEVDAVRHRRCRRGDGVTTPRVHPSGITRG